jgi:hypothetical protein
MTQPVEPPPQPVPPDTPSDSSDTDSSIAPEAVRSQNALRPPLFLRDGLRPISEKRARRVPALETSGHGESFISEAEVERTISVQ